MSLCLKVQLMMVLFMRMLIYMTEVYFKSSHGLDCHNEQSLPPLMWKLL